MDQNAAKTMGIEGRNMVQKQMGAKVHRKFYDPSGWATKRKLNGLGIVGRRTAGSWLTAS